MRRANWRSNKKARRHQVMTSGIRHYCRQRPTLPRSFPRSTIGGIRLNFRVRNGNGCDPDPMTTGILGPGCGPGPCCLGSRLRCFASFGGQAAELRASRLSTEAPKARRRVVPSNLVYKERRSTPGVERTTEYPANGSFDRHFTQRFCVHSLRRRRTTLAGSADKRSYGQASRLISIGKLNVSPRLHTRPITWSSSRSL